MNQITEWISSLWNSDPTSQNTYEPISPEIISNRIKLSCSDERRMGITTYLYLGLDEGKPYIKLVRDTLGVVTEERYMITRCVSSRHFLQYSCTPIGSRGDVEFEFTRIFNYIETFVIYNRNRSKYYRIDVVPKDNFVLFNNVNMTDDSFRYIYNMQKIIRLD